MRKYGDKQYAQALFLALRESGKDRRGEIIIKFLSILREHHATGRLDFILREAERRFLEEEKLRKVELEFADDAPAHIKKVLEEKIGGRIALSEKKTPALIGGVKIFIDGEIMIDASFKRQLDKVFK